MKKSALFCCLLVGMALMAFGCQKKNEEATTPSGPEAAQTVSRDAGGEAVPLAPNVTKENSMVARVNGKTIGAADVDRATDILLVHYGDQIPPDQAAQARTVLRKQALENLISQRLLLAEAERQGFRAEQKALDDRFAETSGRFPSPEEFQSTLRSMGLSKEAFQEEIRQDLVIQALLDKELKDVKKVSAEEVSAFFRDHPESFRSPEQVRASHILIAVDAGASEEQRAQKRQELAKLKQEIDKGADFAQLASQNSDCPSKARGGDLGYFPKGKMVKPFEDAAFGMKVGEVSDIVETQFGYHLIKVTDHQEPKQATLDDVKGQIEKLLNQKAKEDAIGSYIAKLRESAQITYAEGSQP